MESEKELRQDLERMKNDRDKSVAREASKGLRYAEKLSGADKRDVLRHYLRKAREYKNPRRRVDNKDYEGEVLDNTAHSGESITGYTIVDCTSLEAKRVEATLVDVTSVEADSVTCDVLDATTVVADDLNAKLTQYTSYQTKQEKEQREAEKRKKEKERQSSAERTMEQIEDELEVDEREAARAVLENTSKDQHDDAAEMLASDDNPYRILKGAAELLEDEYARPPKRAGHELVETKRGEMEVYVSDVRPKQGAGNSMHDGDWVTMKFSANRRGSEIVVSYKRDGIAGNSDDRREMSLEKATPEKVAKVARDFLGASSLF